MHVNVYCIIMNASEMNSTFFIIVVYFLPLQTKLLNVVETKIVIYFIK